MTSPFIGTWSYRSFVNNPDLTTPFQNLEFGRATLVLSEPETCVVAGTIGGQGWSLNLKGWLSYGAPNTVHFQGTGPIDGETWVYDYLGFLSPRWPNGVDQRPAIVGTIVRTVAHSNGQSPAGFVGSWIAVRRD